MQKSQGPRGPWLHHFVKGMRPYRARLARSWQDAAVCCLRRTRRLHRCLKDRRPVQYSAWVAPQFGAARRNWEHPLYLWVKKRFGDEDFGSKNKLGRFNVKWSSSVKVNSYPFDCNKPGSIDCNKAGSIRNTHGLAPHPSVSRFCRAICKSHNACAFSSALQRMAASTVL
jgi:hypothetical protein